MGVSSATARTVSHSQADALRLLREPSSAGGSWASALLAAIGLWDLPEERYGARHYIYLIQGEAFDWLLLAERLLREVPMAATPAEREELLFTGTLPAPVTPEHFRQALGELKYQAHLNFFYGVTVEEALLVAVEEEVRKARSVQGVYHDLGVQDQAMVLLYGGTTETLAQQYHRDHGRRFRGRMPLGQLTSFTYWLFKRRLRQADGARLASDTQRGLRQLQAMNGLPAPHTGEGGAGGVPQRGRPVARCTARGCPCGSVGRAVPDRGLGAQRAHPRHLVQLG